MVKKIFKFSVVGGSAAILNVIIFFLLEHVIGVGYMYAAVGATSCAVMYHFIMQKLWVFRYDTGDNIASQGLLFFLLAGFNLIVNELLLVLVVNYTSIYPVIGQCIILILLACMNFVLYEKVIFKKQIYG